MDSVAFPASAFAAFWKLSVLFLICLSSILIFHASQYKETNGKVKTKAVLTDRLLTYKILHEVGFSLAK